MTWAEGVDKLPASARELRGPNCVRGAQVALHGGNPLLACGMFQVDSGTYLVQATLMQVTTHNIVRLPEFRAATPEEAAQHITRAIRATVHE